MPSIPALRRQMQANLSWRPVCSTKPGPGQSGLQRETLSKTQTGKEMTRRELLLFSSKANS